MSHDYFLSPTIKSNIVIQLKMLKFNGVQSGDPLPNMFGKTAVTGVALLSLHSQHAQKILCGEKKLEFRRVWASRSVSHVIIYATSPVKKIVAVVEVQKVHRGSPEELWHLAEKIGGGVSRTELFDYFRGRPTGYAIEFGGVTQFSPPIEPEFIMEAFRPPQSFAYLKSEALVNLESLWSAQKLLGPVVLVTGVHGTGKTTMCRAIAELMEVDHRSASELIQRERRQTLPATISPIDLSENQRFLAKAVERLRLEGRRLLLDGHFALMNEKHIPQMVPTDVVAYMGISAVIVVHDSPASISRRLTSRGGEALSVGEISTLQALELSSAEKCCAKLCIPFFKVKSFDQARFNQLVPRFLSSDWK